MPLIPGKSKAAFSKNVSTEMKAGKPQDQSLAIAYNIKKKNAKKKMADGGMAGDTAGQSIQDSINKRIKQGPSPSPSPSQNYDDGGIVSELAPLAMLAMDKGGNVLDAAARQKIAPHNFALPGGRYPIHDAAHARNALARVSQNGSPEEKATVRAKVHAKYPGIEENNMYDGGEVDVNDSNSISRNKGNKPLKDSDWDNNSTIKQAQKLSVTKLSQPKMVGSDAFSVRNRDMHDDEADFGDRIYPETDRAQPEERDNEVDASKEGQDPSDMARQHNNGKPPYMKASEDQYSEDESEEDMNKVQSPKGRYAMGGSVKMAHDDDDLLMSDEPDGDHSEQPDGAYDESRDYGMRSGDPSEADPHTGESEEDMLRRHAMERASFAKGGPVNPKLSESKKEPRNDSSIGASESQFDFPHKDMDEEDSTSLVHEIMSKRKKMADGGEVDGEESLANEIIAKRNSQSGARQNKRISGSSDDQVDLNRNSREALNDEDQMSFNAGKKEQYDDDQISSQPRGSNLMGDSREDDEENEHDGSIVSQIMKKKKSKA